MEVADRPTGAMAASMALQDRLLARGYRSLLLATARTGLCAGIGARIKVGSNTNDNKAAVSTRHNGRARRTRWIRVLPEEPFAR